MFLALLTLLIALLISGVAAYYSIIGLIAIFSAAIVPIAIMGCVLEVGKLVSAAWLYHNWDSKYVPRILKLYLTFAVVVLMFITSMGIFGFLSKAHIEQTTISSDNTLQITILEDEISREYLNIKRAEKTLTLLDTALERYVELGAISKGLNARKEQESEREILNADIKNSSNTINGLEKEKSNLAIEQVKLEAEVGPIKYIAELVYGTSNQELLEKAVRLVIIIIVFVFDPLAVLLVIAANISLHKANMSKRNKINKRRGKIDSTTNVEQHRGYRKVIVTKDGVSQTRYE